MLQLKIIPTYRKNIIDIYISRNLRNFNFLQKIVNISYVYSIFLKTGWIASEKF